MKFKAPIYPKVWFVFLAWLAIIVVVGRILTAGQQSAITEGLQSGIRGNVIVGMLFGLACIGFWKIWKETGFTKVAEGASWWLLVLPGVFIVIFTVFGLSQGDLPTAAIVTIIANAFFVGANEEVMLRGLVFSGMANRFSFLTACLITTVLFGAMHLLNFFSTGELHLLQAVATMFVGLILLAIRVGMGSIIPAIIVHWLWDVSTVLTGTVTDFSGGTLIQIVPLGIIAAPLLFGLIGGTYLWRYSARLGLPVAA